jgi:pimeloyl-ACP methyl ester carboxylesterase
MLQVAGVDVSIEGQGPSTLLLLHGWPDTHRLWDGTVAALGSEFRCARFTWPGFEPGAVRVLPTLDDMIALVREVVDEVCGGQPVTLVLHDWGCLFGYQFAMRHPERVGRIVGVDIGDVHALPNALPATELAGIGAYQLWLASAWRIGGAVGTAMSRQLARWAGAPADPASIHSSMNWPYFLQWFGGEEALPRRSVAFDPPCPMLFVYGKRKPLHFHSEAWADQLARRPSCRVEAFDTGHWPMIEQPGRFHEVLRDWLAATPAAR